MSMNTKIIIKKSEVFDSRKMFPYMWHQCLMKAQELGYKYIDFNGMIFTTEDQPPEYINALCLTGDLVV